MRVRSLAVVVSVAALAAPAAGGAEPVPFILGDGGAVIVPAYVDGQGPHPFLLDTGAAGTAVSAPLARALRLPPVARTVVVTPLGEEIRVVARIGRMAVGSAEAAGLEATVVPGGLLRGAAGILGQDFLARFDYTIDYRRGRVTWSAGGDDGFRVPLHAQGGLFLVDLEQRGRTARLVADTGSGALVLFDGTRFRSEAAREPAEAASASGRRRRVEMRHVRDLTLGPLALRDQAARDPAPRRRWGRRRPAAPASVRERLVRQPRRVPVHHATLNGRPQFAGFGFGAGAGEAGPSFGTQLQPLSKTIFHRPSRSRRHTELKFPVCVPASSKTGPVLRAIVPASFTSTRSGRHEKGAVLFS